MTTTIVNIVIIVAYILATLLYYIFIYHLSTTIFGINQNYFNGVVWFCPYSTTPSFLINSSQLHGFSTTRLVYQLLVHLSTTILIVITPSVGPVCASASGIPSFFNSISINCCNVLW